MNPFKVDFPPSLCLVVSYEGLNIPFQGQYLTSDPVASTAGLSLSIWVGLVDTLHWTMIIDI